MKRPSSNSKSKSRVLWALAIASALGVGVGCRSELDATSKLRCFVQTDCLEGFVCDEATQFCVRIGGADVVDVSEPDAEEVDTGGSETSAPDTVEVDTAVDTVEADTADAGADLLGLDSDDDGVDDAIDNCLNTPNAAQEDYDNNGTGDVCQVEQRTALVITEIMANPESGLGPQPGGAMRTEWALEYVEIYNAGASEVDMTGFVLRTGAGEEIAVPPRTGSANRVAPGGFFVISGTPLIGSDGREVPGWAHDTPSFQLANEGSVSGEVYESVTLTRAYEEDGGGELVLDIVELKEPSPAGRAWTLDWSTALGTLPAIKNDGDGAWCGSWYAVADGRDGGSPAEPNGPCYQAAQLKCDSSPGRELPLDQAVFGDLVEEAAGAESLNHCPGTTTPAIGRDLIYRVRVEQETPVELIFEPLPNVVGDQSDPSATLTLEPWYHLVYWREGVCPTGGFQLEPSVCLEPGDGSQRTTLLLKEGVTYYFAVDGHVREPTSSAEHGRFTLRLSPI